ncbi:MAG: glycosyltransferase family 2 protein [Acidobacteriota bacterium]|nr:glycosyltransferase family 2 protein [Acidobacteriota bacterium]
MSTSMTPPFLSIIIPAYNEADRIGKSLGAIRRFADESDFSVEIIVVDDGSADQMPAHLDRLARAWPALTILRNETNRGKGYSVRRGALASRGQCLLVTDADLSTPIEEARHLMSAMESSSADAVVGSRALNRSLTDVRQPRFREYSGRTFNLFVRLFTGLDIHDTQCGFKLFRRETTKRAFEMQRSRRFGFDPELLFLIRWFGGRIAEVPVRWDNDPATKVRFVRDSARMFADLALLRWRAWRGVYGPEGAGSRH